MKLSGEYRHRWTLYRSYLLAASLLIVVVPIIVCAQRPGSLDPTFDGDGKLIDGLLSHSRDDAYGVAVQADGKIVVAGESAIARYNPDGALDTTFGTGGAITGVYALDVAIQADGKIVVGSHVQDEAGKSVFAIYRYNPNGSRDTSFGTGGRVTTSFSTTNDYLRSIAIGADGKIVAVGRLDRDPSTPKYGFAVARYNASGSLDTTYDGDGKLITPVGSTGGEGSSVAIQADGKVVVAGGSSLGFTIIRYNVNGSLDTSFDSDGIATTSIFGSAYSSYVASVAIQPDGKIVAAGNAYVPAENGQGGSNRFALVRYNTDGSLDSSFDSDGKLTTDCGGLESNAQSVAILSDGKIVAAGYRWNNSFDTDLAVAQYNSNGSLDTNFDVDGIAIRNERGYDVISDVAIQTDGKIVGVGITSGAPTFISTGQDDFIIARFNPNGSLDATFDGDGMVISDFLYFIGNALSGVAIQADGKIVAAGTSLARYNPDGTRDTTFGGSGIVAAPDNRSFLSAVAIQSDGKIVAAGSYNCGNGFMSTNSVLARFDHDGTLDTSFDSDGIVYIGDCSEDSVFFNSVAIQPDGKIVAAGSGVARYNPNGSLDTTFGGGDGIADTSIQANTMALQPDGKIVMAGYGCCAGFDFFVGRLDPDGSPDTSFDGDGYVNAPVNGTANSVAIQPDGKIVAAGNTRDNMGTEYFATVRYNSNGTLDTTFNSDGVVTTAAGPRSSANSLVIQSNGKIIVAGSSHQDFALVRYNPDGSFDTAFGGGMTTVDFDNSFDSAHGMALDGQGRAVVVGGSDGAFAIARIVLSGVAVSVSGRVTRPDGLGVSKATVWMTDSLGVRRNAFTNPFGFYSFDNVAAGGTYTMGVLSKLYRFSPQQVQVDAALTDVNFVANK